MDDVKPVNNDKWDLQKIRHVCDWCYYNTHGYVIEWIWTLLKRYIRHRSKPSVIKHIIVMTNAYQSVYCNACVRLQIKDVENRRHVIIYNFSMKYVWGIDGTVLQTNNLWLCKFKHHIGNYLVEAIKAILAFNSSFDEHSADTTTECISAWQLFFCKIQ